MKYIADHQAYAQPFNIMHSMSYGNGKKNQPQDDNAVTDTKQPGYSNDPTKKSDPSTESYGIGEEE